jgi:hypothetical protein
MILDSRRRFRTAAFAALLASLQFGQLLFSGPCAYADDTIKTPGDHRPYTLEIEPHSVLGWDSVYAAGGYGLGARFSVPLVDNGFVPKINNSVALSFGIDVMHYDGCWYAYGSCSANYVELPVAMQWNFYVSHDWSVFGEPGLVVYHGFVGGCPAGWDCAVQPHVTGVEPAFYAGARYKLGDYTALTMRVGFPTVSVGLSFY